MGDLNAVPNGINVGIVGLHEFVNDYSAGLSDCEAGILRELRIRDDADRDDRQFAGDLVAVGKFDRPELSFIVSQESGDRVIGDDVRRVGLYVVLQDFRELSVQEHQDLRKHLDDRNFNTRELQCLTGLYPDQSPADNDRFFNFPLVADLPEKVGVRHRLKGGYTVQINTGNGRHFRPGAGRDNQFIVGEGLRFSRQKAFNVDGFRYTVDSGNLRIGPGRDFFRFHVIHGVPDDAGGGAEQFVPVVKKASHIIRISAGSHGKIVGL
jgi:hypothetical protein